MAAKLIIFYLLIISLLGNHLSKKTFLIKKNIPEENHSKINENSINNRHIKYLRNLENSIEMKILNVSGELYEHQKGQILNIIFNYKKNTFNPEEIKNITLITTNKSKLYTPNTECHCKSYYSNTNSTNIYCYLDLTYVPKGEYLINSFYYQNNIINDRRTLIKIKEEQKKEKNIENQTLIDLKSSVSEDLKLIGIYGEAYSNNTSLFKLVFNKDVNVNYFSRFYLTDINPIFSYAYFLNFSFYKVGYNSSFDCLFDFNRVPSGSYLLNFIYANKTYPTNITLTVKEKEIVTENDLLDVYSDFKRNNNNQTVYFSFNGRNRNNNLTYIVLKDENSNINVLQTFDCKIIDYDSKTFDLKCNLNLTYVKEGKYSISEYYINGQHYYSKQNINVVVQ